MKLTETLTFIIKTPKIEQKLQNPKLESCDTLTIDYK